MDFKALAKYQVECENKISQLAQIFKIDNIGELADLAREMGFQTRYSKRDSIDKIEYLLWKGKTLKEIAKIYNVSL